MKKETTMKTILNIIMILLVAAVIAGGLSIIVNNTSIASGPDGIGGQPLAMTSANGQTTAQLPERLEGGEEGGASAGRGLLEVLVTLTKLIGITIVVLLLEKGVSLLSKKRMATLA
jgi:hypothetical protein